MKINFNKSFRNIDGSVIEKADSLGKNLAVFLALANKGITIYKAYEWSKSLNKNEALELDTSDYEELENFIKNASQNEGVFSAQNRVLNNNFAGQILEIMKEAKALSAEKKK